MCFVVRDTNLMYLVYFMYLMYDQKLKKKSKYMQKTVNIILISVNVRCLPVQNVGLLIIFLSNHLKTKTQNTPLRVVCLFVKLGVSHCERNRGLARLRTEC